MLEKIKNIPFIACKKCHIVFQQYDGNPLKSHHKKVFCSRKCVSDYFRKPLIIKVCQYCKIDFTCLSRQSKRFCSLKCANTFRNKSEKQKESCRIKALGNTYSLGRKQSTQERLKRSNLIRGEKHWNWKGGISPKNNSERSCIELKDWRRKVFTRDNFTCIMCKIKGKKIEADHIKSWAHYPELRFDINNGRTLCKECHATTPNYKGKGNKFSPKKE